MNKWCYTQNKCWGFLLTALGAFLLTYNLCPESDIILYWPIFLIGAGLCRMFWGSSSKDK
jgi:hypothetical protein